MAKAKDWKTRGPAPQDHIARRIRVRRKLMGLSPDVMAGRLGISPKTLTRYENGAAPVPAPCGLKIAALLNVPFDRLFGPDG